MLDIKTLIKVEWQHDNEIAQIEFKNNKKDKISFVKVPEIEFDRALLQLRIADVLKRINKEDWVNDYRFISIYEITLLIISETENWLIINQFPYKEKKDE